MISIDNKKGLGNLFKLMGGGFIVSVVLVFGYNYNQKEKYPQPRNHEKINGEVVELSTYQSVIKIILDNNKRFMIIDSRNYAYDSYLIQKFIRKGDYLEKMSGSDTLKVIRDNKAFIFVIGQDLNKELKKSL